MKINFDQILKTISGKEMEEPRDRPRKEDETVIPFRLRWVCEQALLAPSPKGAVDGPTHVKRLKLAWRIANTNGDGVLDLSTDDIKVIKDLIAELPWAGPLVVGQCHLMLERKKLDKDGAEISVDEAEPAKKDSEEQATGLSSNSAE